MYYYGTIMLLWVCMRWHYVWVPVKIKDFFKKVVILEKRKALKRAMFRNQFFCLEKSKHRMFVFGNSPSLKLESTETKENLLPQISTRILLCFFVISLRYVWLHFSLHVNVIWMKTRYSWFKWKQYCDWSMKRFIFFSWMGGHFPEFVITDTRHKKVIG